MANDEMIRILKSGPIGWNSWRSTHRESNVNLSGANLRRADLSMADLSEADLFEADLFEADLNGADLSKANLFGAILIESILSGANFSEANLRRAILNEANLNGANLRRADLSKADLYKANLSEANLSGANLSGANLLLANLSEADLCEANLDEANLSEADLSEANLSGANLSEANLSWANLSGANLSGANLFLADLSKADLSKADLSEVELFATILNNADLSQAFVSKKYLELVLARPELLTLEEFSRADIYSVDGNVIRQLAGSSRENVSESVYQIPVEIYISDETVTEEQGIAIREATRQFLKKGGFEQILQCNVYRGSFYQKLLFRFFGRGGKKAGERVLKEGYEVLRQQFIDAPQAQSANLLAEAVKHFSDALQTVNNGVIRAGPFITVKVTRNDETFMIAEMMTPALARELQENPEMLKDPNTVFAFFQHRGDNTSKRQKVVGASNLERDDTGK